MSKGYAQNKNEKISLYISKLGEFVDFGTILVITIM
jgi:hypothetical protein